MIKTIVFDLGGIFFLGEDWSLIASKKYGIHLDKVKDVIKEYNKCAVSAEKSEQFWIDFRKKLRINDDWKNVRNFLIGSISISKEIAELIKKLKNKYEVLFLSNSHIDFTPELEKKFSFKKEFHGGLLSHEYPFYKPDKRFYSELLSRTSSKSEEIVFIDDVENNLKPAYELGMHTILFKDIGQLKEELMKLGINA
ncbi:MAG: HAD-IA family hydrolase [Nanoarchaeota archaeon]|nr:HAD-IA family hydrolase [Nanoarchaeota archaeon]